MPEISLTEFVDFVIKSGTPKLTEVKRIKKQHLAGYHPTRDYWCKMRDGIVEMHQQAQENSALDEIVHGAMDTNKKNTYPLMAKAYKKFLGRKSVEWFNPARNNWKHDNLLVRVNPELGLKIDGEPYLIKLYFKDQKLTSDRIAIINQMMLEMLSSKARGAKIALLDVRHSKLHTFDTPNPAILPLLEGEALSFCRMYESA